MTVTTNHVLVGTKLGTNPMQCLSFPACVKGPFSSHLTDVGETSSCLVGIWAMGISPKKLSSREPLLLASTLSRVIRLRS